MLNFVAGVDPCDHVRRSRCRPNSRQQSLQGDQGLEADLPHRQLLLRWGPEVTKQMRPMKDEIFFLYDLNDLVVLSI